ncbi:MAG: ADP-forming succinate--CoA ligase subunit beta, partial [Candidatus Omnitrophica bacterium]|nr:ADP-forming succinate--CoA ligase subunit beta [Candidatus Omnitrophota bacterium]
MNIHEYQAKTIFQKYGLKIPRGRVFDQGSLSPESIRSLGYSSFVVKAQVHAGGRGKAGGIKIVQTIEEAFQAARGMLGKTLTTYQTEGAAKPIDWVLIEEAGHMKRELYVAVAMDREQALPCVIGSEAGGVDIETVARETPEKVFKFHFDPDQTLVPGLFTQVASKFAGTSKELARFTLEFANLFAKLAQIFVELDASLVEVNPLGLMSDGSLLPIDAKINFDDNGLFRHPEIALLHDPRQEDSRENEAKKFDLSYVSLEGNIGCMVNGAGLAMATMDIIKLHGGEPANFLDVGGGASKEKV